MAKQQNSVHEDEVVGRIFEWRLYRRFLPFAKPYMGWFSLSVVLLMFLAAAGMAGPLVIREATGLLVGPMADAMTAEEQIDGLGFWALVMVGIGLSTFGLRFAQIWIAARTGQRIIFDLRNHVFRHIQRRNLRFFDTNPVGRLVTRVTSDIEALTELFSSGIDVVFYDIIVIGLTMGVLFWVNPTLALLTLALLPFVGAWSFYFKREAQELFRNVRSRVTRLNSFINETVTGIRVIQIFRSEKRVRRQFEAWDDDLRVAHRRTVKNFSLFFPGIEVFSSFGAAVIVIGGHHLIGQGELEPKDMLFFWFMMHKFFEPLRQISEKYNVLQSALASAERIDTILGADEEVANPAQPVPMPAGEARGHIVFDGALAMRSIIPIESFFIPTFF